jgi:predicted thioesterase
VSWEAGFLTTQWSIFNHSVADFQLHTTETLEVTVRMKLAEVDGRHPLFEVEADDGMDLITRGTVRWVRQTDERVLGRMGEL